MPPRSSTDARTINATSPLVHTPHKAIQSIARQSRATSSVATVISAPLTAQIKALQLRNKAADQAGVAAGWRALMDAHPEPLVLSAYVKWLRKEKQVDDALALIDRSLPPEVEDPILQLQRAELLDDAAFYEQSDALFESMIAASAESTKLRVNFTKRLRKRGLIMRALDVMIPVVETLPRSSRARTLYHEVEESCALLRQLEPERLTRDADARILAMRQAILMFRDRPVRPRSPNALGRLVLITGSMGPGGAERQIVRIATHLEQARRENGAIGEIMIEWPVEVLVKSLSSTSSASFFAPDLAAAGVTLRQIDDMPVDQPDLDESSSPDLANLLKMLPPQANYGVGRLTQYLRDSRIDVAGLWQDGACFFAALAALIAGVPTIQLSFRGLPPIVRRHMFRPEYEDLYRALAQIPGVQFHCNSKVTAQAYANWLDLPVERFTVIYNGVAEHPTHGCAASMASWAAFKGRTADATRTIGGVFRFDTDKRPLTWIRLAARFHRRFPDTRFVIVGDGRLMTQAQALAVDLGISDRILYVGNSVEVGYWMAQMDVLVLTSLYEGLPNVLIEAQMIGTPVVSTPAGGASECFIEGVTGHILDCADKPDLDAACERIEALMLTGDARTRVGEIARRNARERFSVEHMVCHFTKVSGTPLAYPDSSADELSRTFAHAESS